MAGDWLRRDRAELGAQRILDAAGEVYAEQGVQATSMSDIAGRAGCSRATLYTYFPNRHALQVGYLNRGAIDLAARIGTEVGAIDDPVERLTAAVLAAVGAVRATPGMAVWFEPADVSVAMELAASSEVLDAIVGAFAVDLGPGVAGDPHTAARWIIRTIISLITMPGRDHDEERDMVQHFVARPLVGGARPDQSLVS